MDGSSGGPLPLARAEPPDGSGLATARRERPNPVVAYLGRLAPTSRASARSSFRVLVGLFGRAETDAQVLVFPWWDLRVDLLQAAKARLVERYEARSVNRMLSFVRGVLHTAWLNGQMASEEYQRCADVRGVALPDEHAGRALSADELKRLFVTGDPFDAALLAVMFGAGLRRVEVTRLDLADVDKVARTLSVLGKGSKRRAAFVPPGWWRVLERWIAARGAAPGPLFPRPHGTRHSVASLAERLRDLRRTSGVFFTPHDLRRSCGTAILRAGKDLAAVQKVLGHKYVTTTTLYDRRDEDVKRDAVAVLDLPFLEEP